MADAFREDLRYDSTARRSVTKWAEEKGDRSRPYRKRLCLSCFSLDCVVNLFSRLVVNLHVVLLTTMLLDFRHDLSFAVCGDLPIAVFRANVRTAETQFLITVRFALSDCHVYPPAAMLLPIS